jgi:hypothetical protein
LKLQGQVAGGIGISGGSVEEDERVAKPILDILAEMESLAEWIKPFFLENIKGTGWMRRLEENLEQGFLKVGCILPHDFISIFAGAIIIAADGH